MRDVIALEHQSPGAVCVKIVIADNDAVWYDILVYEMPCNTCANIRTSLNLIFIASARKKQGCNG